MFFENRMPLLPVSEQCKQQEVKTVLLDTHSNG